MNKKPKSVGVKDVNQQDLVNAVAKFLKTSDKVKVPEYCAIVKTAVHKELAPYQDDWFYIRCASIARHLYLRSPVGVGALRKVYGGRHRRGVRPSRFCLGGGSIARNALKALEGCGWVRKGTNDGRVLTSQGVKDLDRLAAQLRMKGALDTE